jgi:hypothetical protein
MGGGGITGIHKSSSAPGRFLQLMSTDMSLPDSMKQMKWEGIFQGWKKPDFFAEAIGFLV